MSATIFIEEPESLVKSELSQLGRQRSTRQILTKNHYDNAPRQKGAAHLLLLPEGAGDRPYQHGLVSVGSESAADDDDEYCELELERCLMEEMDGMDSSGDGSPKQEDDDDSYNHNDEKIRSKNELESELEDSASDGGNANNNDNDNDNNNGRVENVFASLEWSQFVSSADGVRRYMEGATAEIIEVSHVVLPSLRQQSKTRHGRSSDVAAIGAREDVVDSAEVLVDSAEDVVDSGKDVVDPGENVVDPVRGIEVVRSSYGKLTESVAPVIPPDGVKRASINLALGPVASPPHIHDNCRGMHDNCLDMHDNCPGQQGGGVAGGRGPVSPVDRHGRRCLGQEGGCVVEQRGAHTDTTGGDCSASNGYKAPQQPASLADRSRDDSLNVSTAKSDSSREDDPGVAHASLNTFVAGRDISRREDDEGVVRACRSNGVERDNSREDGTAVVLACQSKGVSGKLPPSRVQSEAGNPTGKEAQPGCNDEKTFAVVATSSIPDVTAASSTPTTPRQAVLGSPPIQQVPLVNVTDANSAIPTPTIPRHAVLGSPAPPTNVRMRTESGTGRVKPESQVVRSFEADRRIAREQEVFILRQLKETCGGIPGEESPSPAEDACISQSTAVVVASVQEEEVERRIQRNKTGSVEKRRHQMAIRLQRARQTRSARVFQTIWRGHCTRAHVSQIRAAHRQELEETNRMFQEHQLATRVAALEAKQKEEERGNRLREQSAMRDEDERASKAWNHLARSEKSARAEEVARMRAEERYTRALLDLERQDAQRVDRAKHEAAELVMMRFEDVAAQELRCLEKAQAMERGAMATEDALAREWKLIENHRLAVSQSERCRMAVEDRECLAWNAEHRLQQEQLRVQARTRSTPIQRAMDPRGIATARSLTCGPLPPSVHDHPGLGFGAENGVRARSEGPTGFEQHSRELVQERARRRECCKDRLDRISARSLNASNTIEGSSKKIEGSAASSTCLGNNSIDSTSRDNGGADRHPRGDSATGRNGGNGHDSSREGRVGPAERDGEECDLTADMLSHLGPLQDLAELELCVEGLTSASLLRECTSLKSLSLNVNRLSSPAGLVASTSLVRLGLRDNRLTSLQGLSGLLSLRELRLDINHLTSLHELTSLPSLIELSANTNHIRALPEGFAAALMAFPPAPVHSTKKARLAHSTKPLLGPVVEPAAACGGLQKLELYHNRIASVHPRALDGLTSLTHLDLGRNQLKALDGRGLESCPALSTLVLSQNLLREPPSPLCLPLLSELWLSGNQISSMGAWAHAPPPQAPPFAVRDRKRRTSLETSSSKKPPEVPAGLGVGLGGCPRHQGTINRGKNSSSALEESGRGANERDDGLEGGGSTFARTAGRRGEEDGGGALAQSGVYADDGSVVWLPTLEVLHLQDNCLESLGGRWSLAGCPLLRSFDASFNRLRAPDEIARCLQACGDVREVRLHDNPASECQTYADTIALSCPRLVRIDGVPLDTAVHWRAAEKIYGRRAETVLPFLLSDETEPSGSSRGGRPVTTNSLSPIEQTDHAIGEQTDRAISDHTTGEPNASRLDFINEPQQCPWCGEATSNATHTAETPSGSDVGSRHHTSGSTADQPGRRGDAATPSPTSGSTADQPGRRGDAATPSPTSGNTVDQPGGETDAATYREGGITPPNSNNIRHSGGSEGGLTPPHSASTGHGDGWRRRRFTCASCRGALPDTDLWRVQGSRDSRCPVRWDHVLSEGRRWRAEFFSARASTGDDSVKTDNDGVVVGDAFKRICLGGRDERASMRHRHRREERAIMSSGHPDGAQTQTEHGARNRAESGAESSRSTVVRSGSSMITTSRRERLETELDLGMRHAKERGDLAARQLRCHATGGGNVCKARIESNGECVVIKLGTPLTEKDQGQHVQTPDQIYENKSGGAERVSAPRRRDQAVRVIQRLWHRRQERAAVASRAGALPPSGRGLNVHAGGGASERAVTTLQSTFRGFHVRRALQAALDSARYVDEEVEGLLSGNGGNRFELHTFLAPPPELADGWLGDHAPIAAPPDGSNAALHRNPPHRNAAGIGNPSGRVRATSNRFIDTACAIVSNAALSTSANTPLSASARISQGRGGSHDGVEMETPSGGVFDAGGSSRGDGASATTRSSAGHTGVKNQDALDLQAEEAGGGGGGGAPAGPSRIAPGVIQEGKVTQGSRGASHEGQTERVSNSRDSSGGSGDSGGGIGDGGPVGAEEGLVKAWGLSDPSVARAMMKRAKRLRKFQNAEARRVKLREPEARFNAFTRKAGGHRTLRSMSDLSRRDIDDKIGIQRPGAAEAKRGQGSPVSDRGVGMQRLGAADAKRVQQRSPASDGARTVVRPRSGGPVEDETWARGETAAPRRTALLPSAHVHLLLHSGKGVATDQTHQKEANPSSPLSEDHHLTAIRPPSTSSSCAARPWPPPKPHHHYHDSARPPQKPNSHCREKVREAHGGGLTRQSSGGRGGRNGFSSQLSSGVRGGGRPRATLCAVELGAEALMGDANWVGYGAERDAHWVGRGAGGVGEGAAWVGAGGGASGASSSSSKVLRGENRPSSGGGGRARRTL